MDQYALGMAAGEAIREGKRDIEVKSKSKDESSHVSKALLGEKF